MNSKARGYEGFSLFEIIVSLGVLSVVTTIGTTAYIGLTGAWRDTRTLTEMDDAANAAMDSIERDVMAIVPPVLSNTPLRGSESTTEDTRYLHVGLADDQLVLPILVENANGGAEPRSVMYRLSRSEESENNRLMRVVGPLGDENPKAIRTDVVSRFEVIELRFEYAADDAAGWATGWTGGSLPRAIRVSMTLMSRSQRHLQLSRMAVFAVPVYE